MKENWEIKKLGDIFDLQMGKTPSRNNLSYWDNGTHNWLSISDMNNVKYITETKEKISDKAVEDCNMRIVPENTVLMSFKLSIGKVAITKNPIYTNEAIMSFRNISDKKILNEYLYYCLSGKDWSGGNRAVMGKTLNKQTLSQNTIPIPPLPVQEAIVKELDVLHRLKELQEQQLVEYDNLAQSTFYSMFGDPIENEKGWEVRKLGDVAPVKSFKGNVQKIDNKFWLLNLDVVEQQSGEILSINLVEESEINQSTVTFNEENVLYSKLRPYLNKVVIPHTSGYCTSELLPLLPQKDLLNRVFLTLLLRSQSFVQYIQEKTNGAKMPRVNMDEFRNFMLIIPPLSLQTDFANRIEKIEAQKELVKQGIAETQLLIDYTMDKYFG